MSQEKLHTLLSNFLVGTGTTSAGVAFWSNLDLTLSLLLKFVSLATFVIYVLINQDNIEHNWTKLRKRFKRDGTKTKA